MSSPSFFKCSLKHKYSSIVNSVYDVEMACTWLLFNSTIIPMVPVHGTIYGIKVDFSSLT